MTKLEQLAIFVTIILTTVHAFSRLAKAKGQGQDNQRYLLLDLSRASHCLDQPEKYYSST